MFSKIYSNNLFFFSKQTIILFFSKDDCKDIQHNQNELKEIKKGAFTMKNNKSEYIKKYLKLIKINLLDQYF